MKIIDDTKQYTNDELELLADELVEKCVGFKEETNLNLDAYFSEIEIPKALIKFKLPKERTILHKLAASEPSSEAITDATAYLIHFFIESGANVNERDRKGITPLMLSASLQFCGVSSRIKLMGALLEKKADPNLIDNEERSALFYSLCRYEYYDSIKIREKSALFLLKYGAIVTDDIQETFDGDAVIEKLIATQAHNVLVSRIQVLEEQLAELLPLKMIVTELLNKVSLLERDFEKQDENKKRTLSTAPSFF